MYNKKQQNDQPDQHFQVMVAYMSELLHAWGGGSDNVRLKDLLCLIRDILQTYRWRGDKRHASSNVAICM